MSVSEPKSPDFRRFLTPAQVQARFGATAAQVRAMRSWLVGAGLTVTRVTRHYLAVSGPSAAVQRAFGVAIHSFAAQGGKHYAPAGAVTVPKAMARGVLAVTGLDNSKPAARPQDALPGPAPAHFRPNPCSNFFGAKTAPSEPFAFNHVGEWVECGLTPQQVHPVTAPDIYRCGCVRRQRLVHRGIAGYRRGA
jgi:Pro-kumamolisin, activation domain